MPPCQKRVASPKPAAEERSRSVKTPSARFWLAYRSGLTLCKWTSYFPVHVKMQQPSGNTWVIIEHHVACLRRWQTCRQRLHSLRSPVASVRLAFRSRCHSSMERALSDVYRMISIMLLSCEVAATTHAMTVPKCVRGRKPMDH